MDSQDPTKVEDMTLFTPSENITKEVDQFITEHPIAIQLRGDCRWKESRPHLRVPDAIRSHHLTAGTLAGPGMLTVPPLFFNKLDGSEMVQIFHIGNAVSGPPGIVHGGFLATMLDEGLSECVFPAMRNKTAVTANLNINYRRPVVAGQFFCLRARTTRVEGRKAWAEGWVESLRDAMEELVDRREDEKSNKVRLVEAEALLVEPKYALD